MGRSRHLIRLAHPGWTPALGSSRSGLSGRRSRGGHRASGQEAHGAAEARLLQPAGLGPGVLGLAVEVGMGAGCLGLAGEVRRRCVQDARHLLMRSGAPEYVSSVNSQKGTEGWAESRAGDQGAGGNGSPPTRAWRGARGTVVCGGGVWMGRGKGLLKEGE